jgi:alpha,alpha-trehalase
MLSADYWDSYWIVEGLIQSQLYDIANGTLQNFMDEIERFGFVPNGGRIYCSFLLPVIEDSS